MLIVTSLAILTCGILFLVLALKSTLFYKTLHAILIVICYILILVLLLFSLQGDILILENDQVYKRSDKYLCSDTSPRRCIPSSLHLLCLFISHAMVTCCYTSSCGVSPLIHRLYKTSGNSFCPGSTSTKRTYLPPTWPMLTRWTWLSKNFKNHVIITEKVCL